MHGRQISAPWIATETDRPQNIATPFWLVDTCAVRFAGGRFMLDVCAEQWSAKAPFFIDVELDALLEDRPWHVTSDVRTKRILVDSFVQPPHGSILGNRNIAVWCNPPYNDIDRWVRRAMLEVQRGSCRVVVMCIPARTESTWWHEVVRPFAWHVELVDGRVAFEYPPEAKAEDKSSPYEATAIVVFQNRMTSRR